MPGFPCFEQLEVPALLERFVPGKLHPDGRRYLPLVLLRLDSEIQIGVVDRHHCIDPRWEGLRGTARLVFLLSAIELQPPRAARCGLDPGHVARGRASTAPDVFGRVVAVPGWETDDRSGVATLYTELLLDIGLGTVGVRTSSAWQGFAAAYEKERVEVGDWLAIRRSRIDILEFVADH